MKSLRIGLGVFGILLCFSSTLRAGTELSVERAVDGETVELTDGRKVRLIGVATNIVRPLLAERYQLTPEQMDKLPLQNLTADAVSYIQNHAVGKNIILSFDTSNERRNHTDSEGRLLAYVWYTTYSRAAASAETEGASQYLGVASQDHLLNQELITMGLALVDTASPFVQQKLFLEHEKNASQTKQGFWRSAAELYNQLLGKAEGAQYGATAGFIDEKARELSLKSAWEAYEKLIEMNPKDPRPYYERSWLGAHKTHDKISGDNLKDIDQAIKLSPFDPKGSMQRHYLLMLLEKYPEALEAYERSINLASKLGMPTAVSKLAEAELEKPEWKEFIKDPGERRAALEAVRATLNEDHFLFFMAWMKSQGGTSKNLKALEEKVSKLGRFADFKSRNEKLLDETPHAVLYKTQWAERGVKEAEDVIRWIETVGDAPSNSTA